MTNTWESSQAKMEGEGGGEEEEKNNFLIKT